MEGFRHDVVVALRLLGRERAYAAAVILTLAICLGANAAVFTVVRSVLMRPLPYPDSGALVFSYDSFPGAGVERAGTSVPNYVDRAALTDVFDSVALYQNAGYRVGEGAAAEGMPAMNVTPSFFTVLRTTALRGRLFTGDDGTPGRDKVVLVSQAFAARHAAGVDGIVGQSLRVNNEAYQVVGVLPDTFHFLNPAVRLFVPLAFTPEQRAEDERYSQNHQQIARLGAGVTVAQAQARVDALNAHYVERAGPLKSVLINAGYTTRIVPFADDLVRDVRAALEMLWGGALFVVLIAAVNITNLSIVRAGARLKELATRYAMGAVVGRIARQLITETTLLTVIGGALGLAIGVWSLDALAWLGLSDLPRAHEIRPDAVVYAATLGLALLLGAVVGVVPALRLARVNLSHVLRDGGRGATTGVRTRRVRRALVVAQVSLAFVLLVAAGLLLTSFRRLLAVDPGFTAQQLLTAHVSPLEARYPDASDVRTYAARVLDRVRGLPGVEVAGITNFLPFSWDDSSSVIIPEGYVPAPGESVVSPYRLRVTPGYLEALRVKLQRGRFFTDADTDSAPGVVIIDDALAERFWPNADPIGRRLYLPDVPDDVTRPGPKVTWLQVVGVVARVKLKGLVDGENTRAGAYYLSYFQDKDPSRNIGLAVRTRGDVAATSADLQRVLAALDPEAPAYDVFAMSERIERSLTTRRAPMLLTIIFGTVALLLAAVGLYGVLAYQVSQRTREIGIRMALGSDAAGILRLVLREGMWLVGLGLVVGVAGAALVQGAIASQLYEVSALDARVLLVATAVLTATAAIAASSPARRAARVNPVVALSDQ